MIKYLGTVGCFVRLNDDVDSVYNFLNVFSSSSNATVLFSASVNNSTGQITTSSIGEQIYINGVSASIIPGQKWNHVIITFPEKLSTTSDNNFNIRFGDYQNSNFNMQNLYILESSLLDSYPQQLHESFTGGQSQTLSILDSASFSINVIDYLEDNFVSASSQVVYQPLKNQYRYLFDVAAVKETSLTEYVSASTLFNDDLYIDGFNITNGDKILSLEDNQIYELTASSQLNPISSSAGDFVKILFGSQYGNTFYLNTDSGFQITPARQKITSFVNIIDTNNV